MIENIELMLPAWFLISALNIALASFIATGLALGLSRLRSWSLPLRHAVLVASVMASLGVPVAALVLGGSPFATIQLGEESHPVVAVADREPDRPEIARGAVEYGLAPSGRHDSPIEDRPQAMPVELAAPAHIEMLSNVRPSDRPAGRYGTASPARFAGTVLTAIWLAGIVVGLLQMIRRAFALVRWARTLHLCESDLIRRAVRLAADHIGLRRPVAVLVSGTAPAPATFGLISPKLVVPSGIEADLSFEQLAAVMRHELAHILRRDLWVGILQEVAQVVYWWNPFVRLANSRLSELREQICDDMAAGGLREPRDYALSLIEIAARSAQNSTLPATLGIGKSSARQMEARIRRIVASRGPTCLRLTRRAGLGVVAIAVVMTASMLLAQVRLHSQAETSPSETSSAPRTPDLPPTTASNPSRPSLQDLHRKIAEHEQAYLPYRIKAMETFRVSDDLTPQERLRYPWSDGRKHQKLIEYAQTGERLWCRKETILVDGKWQSHSERYSDGKQLLGASYRSGPLPPTASSGFPSRPPLDLHRA